MQSTGSRLHRTAPHTITTYNCTSTRTSSNRNLDTVYQYVSGTTKDKLYPPTHSNPPGFQFDNCWKCQQTFCGRGVVSYALYYEWDRGEHRVKNHEALHNQSKWSRARGIGFATIPLPQLPRIVKLPSLRPNHQSFCRHALF